MKHLNPSEETGTGCPVTSKHGRTPPNKHGRTPPNKHGGVGRQQQHRAVDGGCGWGCGWGCGSGCGWGFGWGYTVH